LEIEMAANIVKKLRKTSRFILIGIGLLAACAPAAARSTQEISPGTTGSTANSPTDTTSSSAAPTPTVDLRLSNIPFVPLLPRDAIAPVYSPEFVSADDSPLHEDELIMGVAIEGQAKAYPVTVLRFREMVNDELAGLPILVTW
jgi:hypothetical protein